MLYLDLDGFKAVNDSIGHPQGDRLLIEVARRLRTALRETDTVARLGGDEFAIVQTSVEQPAAAVALCQRLLQLLAEPYDLDGQQLRLGVSIGVAMIPADGANDVEILRAADHALYRAKAAGRGTFRLAGHDSELTPPAASSNVSILDERELSASRRVALTGGDDAKLAWAIHRGREGSPRAEDAATARLDSDG
jgi:diguanylate cyclase (GGDEF)-like protein